MKTPTIPFLSSLTRRIGVDLGTQTIRIWSDKEGLVIEEPACIAVETRSQKVIAVGKEAEAMRGRVGKDIIVYEPIKHGILHDFDVARAMLKVFLQRVFHSPYFFRPLIMVSVPHTSTPAHREAVIELFHAVGAREVVTISQPLAAAIGAGVPIADASGTFLMQLGHGISEAAIISLGSIVTCQASDRAGHYLDTKVKQRVHDAASLVISESTAQNLKEKIGSVLDKPERQLLITGQDVISASPKEVSLESSLIQPSFKELAERYDSMLKKLLSSIPPELTVDVIDKGMLLSGGLSQLKGLDQYLISTLGISVSIVEQPEKTVIRGIETALENIELFKESLGYQT